MNRANLNTILKELKLAAEGLVEPENAKKLGKFYGVDAIIIGTVTPLQDEISVTTQIIDTETAEVLGGKTALIPKGKQIAHLLTNSMVTPKPPVERTNTTETVSIESLSEKAEVVKSFGDLGVELNSLSVANEREYTLDLILKNHNSKKSIWVAVRLNENGTGTGNAVVRSPERVEFEAWAHLVSGVETCPLSYKGTFHRATEIKPGDSIPASIKFTGRGFGPALPGACTVQLAFLLGYTMNRGYDSAATPHTLFVKMKAK